MLKVIARIWNFFFGWLGLRVGELEAQAPEVVYQNTINSLKQRHSVAHTATSSVKAREIRLRKRLAQLEDTVAQDQIDLDAAVDQGQDDLAKLLIDKKEQGEASVIEAKHDLESAEADLSIAVDALDQVAREIQKLQDEKEDVLSKLASADARDELRKALDGLSSTAGAESLNNVREKVNQRIAGNELDKQIKDKSMDEQLKKLRSKTSATDADKKLAALKADRSRKAAS